MKHYNPDNRNLSRSLRTNMTQEEKKLWYDFLKHLSVQFYRQKPIGRYVVDFYCPSARLVVELDGSQHYEERQEKYDKERDEFFSSLGFTVKRYSNLELKRNFQGVCQDILNYLGIEQ